MSLRPRPASSAHRKRPLRVSAPPPGWLPTGVSLPTGESRRPLGWILVPGPIRPGGVVPPLWPSAVVVIAAASSAARSARWTRFTGRILSRVGRGREGPRRVERRWLAEDEPARPLSVRRQTQVRQALERARDGGVRLEPREMHPDADVRAGGKGEVLFRVGARDVEAVRIGEEGRVAVRGCDGDR